jgi:hypothetical protein
MPTRTGVEARTRPAAQAVRSIALDVFGVVVLGLVAALAKRHLDFNLGIPGHAGVGWIACLVAGSSVVRRPGAAAAAGGLMAVWGVPVGLGHSLAYNAGLYGLAGALIDGIRLVGVGVDRPLGAAAAGVAAHLAKFGYIIVAAWVSGIVRNFEVFGLLASLRNHVVFGVAGGVLGWLVLACARRAGRRRRER